MAFCVNCGTKTEDDNQKYCKSCGFSFQNEEVEASENDMKKTNKNNREENQDYLENTTKKSNEEMDSKQKTEGQQEIVKQKERSNKKMKKWPIYAAIALLVVLISAHLLIKSYIDPIKAVTVMDEDFQKENKEAFLNHFDYSSKIHADATSFYDFVEEQSWSEVRTNLLVNVEKISNDELVDPVTDKEGNKLIKLIKEPFLGGIYTKVSFEIVPTQVKVFTDFEQVDFTFENEKIPLGKENSVFVGEFLPGEFEWEAILKAELGNIPFDGKMAVGRNANNNEETLKLEIEPNYSVITTNNMASKILVNKKVVESNFYGEATIGPLPLDGSVVVHAEVTDDGKKYKTDSVKVKEEKVNLNFKYLIDKEMQKATENELQDVKDENYSSIQTFYQDFRKAYESDVNSHSYDAVPSYVESGTALDKDYAGYFKTFKKNDEINNHTNYLLDLEVIDKNTFKFNTEEEYTFYSHKDKTVEYSFKKTYTIVTSGDSYKIKSIESKKVSQKEEDNE